MESIRVLYVEDDPADRELTHRHLEYHAPHLKLRTAETVAEALDQLTVGDVDLILADYRLPDGTGLDLLEAMNSQEFRVPVVLITGFGDVETAVRLLKAGAADYVVKRPGYPERLPAVVEGALRWFKSVRELRRMGVRVLYAEHDPADVEFTERVFRQHGSHLQLEIASRGRDALERLRTVPYDLFLLDYRMPDLSGLEILKALREERIQIPVVVITAHADEEVAVQAFKLGVADYVVKREGYLTKLPSTLENVVAQRRLADENDALLVLNELTESLASLREPSQLHQLVARAAKDLLRAKMSILWRVEGTELVPAGWAGIEDPVAASLRFRVNEQLLERSAITRRVNVGDLLGVEGSLSPTAALFENAWRALAVSLLKDGRVAGVLAMTSYRPREFSATEARLLTILADHASIAIENARLYQQVRDQLVELQRTQAQLLQTEKLAAMGSLLAGVAHELNNPLSVVAIRAALLRDAVGQGPLAAQVQEIAQAAESCAAIVRHFGSLARQQPPERQEVRLNQVVQAAVGLFAYQLRVDDVEVTLDLAEDLPVLWADPHQLHQVVVNLIANAHYALRGSLPRRLTLTTRYNSTQARFSLEVADTGLGIAPEIQSRIFEPFFTTKPVGEGTGLGLSICRGLVESHGGTIRVASQPGQGAIFRIELPMVAPPQRVPEAPSPEPRVSVRGKTILVVDDDSSVATVMAELLTSTGYQVDTAANGALALDKLAERGYDLVLCDIKMPVLDGRGLYREVERRHPELCARFVFLTADVLSAETHEFLKQTRAPRMIKPFAMEEFWRVVQRILRAH